MNIEKFIKKYNLGNIKNIDKLSGGLMHRMFKVGTDKGTYCIKVLNPEVMNRKEAYDNFMLSERIANLAKNNNIPVSSALNIDSNYLTKLDDDYYMVFDYIDGKVLSNNEITIKHCIKIASILGKLHSLDYTNIEFKKDISEYKEYDWNSYIDNANFNNMEYKELLLNNYKKYNSILKRVYECFNESNNYYSLCHMDMDPKNVMWNNNNPIVIDWECAKVGNPNIEILEDSLCWSGFLSDNFNQDKFISMFKEYSKYRNIDNIDWYNVICSNLISRFNWLKYNLERSLGILTNDIEEIKLATKEVSKTINEINRYIELIGTMYKLITNLKIDNKYDKEIKIIIENNNFLNDNYKLINSGFTNTIYEIDKYIVRICTDIDNEKNFKKEIDFYTNNKDNTYIPKIYNYDLSKSKIPYYYEIIEKIEGKTLYQIWYKLNTYERINMVKKIIEVLKSIHSIKVNEYDFNKYIQTEIKDILIGSNLSLDDYKELFNMCDIFFKENKFGIIHNDIHFDNFIYNDKNEHLKLIDFERYMIGSIDYDFKRLSMYKEMPWLWASIDTDMLTVENDYQDLINMFLDNYEELNSIPYIKERLDIYTIIEYLYQYKNTKRNDRLERAKTIIKELGDKYVK